MLWCSSCHGPHAKIDCPRFKEIKYVPLETPSHNGPYVGTVPVRVLAPGESGEMDDASWQQKGDKGRAVQSRLASQVKIECSGCGVLFVKRNGWNRRMGQWCSKPCYQKFYKRRKRAKDTA